MLTRCAVFLGHGGGGGGALAHTRPLLGWTFWGKSQQTPVNSATNAETFLRDAADGMGQQAMGGSGAASSSGDPTSSGGGAAALPWWRAGGAPSFFPGSAEAPGTSVPTDDIDSILVNRGSHLTGPNRSPVSYDIQIQKDAREREARAQQRAAEHDAMFDEMNMPRNPNDPNRKLASWEFRPTPEHRSLVLLLYRNILKGLLDYKSVRRRSMIAYARICFRRRSHITEKLLVDECIEECRRALYILGKHHDFTRTRTYEFENMSIPKDTGQDVKTYMEEVYDPEVSRMQFQSFTDVQPGKEHLHQQKMGPTSGDHHWKGQTNASSYKVEIRDEDKALRPPPPPEMP